MLKELGAEDAAYRLQWVREPHLTTDITQSNTNFLAAGSATRRYVVFDGVPPNVLSRGHCEVRLLAAKFVAEVAFARHPADL